MASDEHRKRSKESSHMKIVIAGAGTIGQHIAEMLQTEQQDVTLIDHNADHLAEVGERLDIQTLLGSANDPSALHEAGVETARLFLAMTDNDEANLISAMTAHQMGANKTVARVRQPYYQTSTPISYCQLLDIDMLLSPERLTALEIIKHINQPAAIAIENFANGRLQLRQFRMPEGHPYQGKPLIDLRDDLPPDLLIAMIAHHDELIIPNRGDNVIQPDDRVTVLGKPSSLDQFAATFEKTETEEPINKIFIAGGGSKGFLLAQMLEGEHHSVTLMERSRERCEFISNQLTKPRIVLGDATRLPMLTEERAARADLFVAAMGDDEDNLMACLQAKSLGAPKLYTVMNRPDYAQTLEKFGIDLALSPRHIIANRTLAFLKRGKIRSLSIIEEGRAEVVELMALPDTPAVQGPLRLLNPPRGVLIALVMHNGQAVVPRGDTAIIPGDIVVALSLTQDSPEVERFFGSKDNE